MTPQKFDELVDKMIAEEKAIGETKGVEYTQGDRLDNFKRIAAELDIDPLKVWWVYFKKHIDSIASYIKTGKVYSESIQSRIMDARVYLSLCRGLIEEQGVDVTEMFCKCEDPVIRTGKPEFCVTCNKSTVLKAI